MKNLYILLSFIFLMPISSTLHAQDFMDLLKNSDYKTLATHFDHEVNIEFKRDRQTLSKQNAIVEIEKRMTNFAPTSWEIMHKGKSDSTEENYVIAKIYNNKNEGLRIFMHIEVIDGTKKICSIRFRPLLG